MKQRLKRIISKADKALSGLSAYYIPFYIVVALSIGLLFSFAEGPEIVPDDMTHMSQMMTGMGTGDYFVETHDYIKGSGWNEVPIDFEKFNETRDIHFKAYYHFWELKPHKEVLKYLPSAIGFETAALFKLPIWMCLEAGEIFALIFAVACGAAALYLMPVKKNLLMFFLLSPMVLQQTASYNYDATVLPLTFLMFALIMNMKFRNNPNEFGIAGRRLPKVGWSEIIALLLMAYIISLAKPPYVLTLLLIILVPHDKFDLKLGRFSVSEFVWKWRLPLVCAAVIFGITFIWIFRDNDLIKMSVAPLTKPKELSRILLATHRSDWGWWIRYGFVGFFGQYNVMVSERFYNRFFIVMLILMLANEDINKELGKQYRPWQIIYSVLLGIGIWWLTVAAILDYTLDYKGIDTNVPFDQYRMLYTQVGTILGYQGRYMLPIAPVALTPIFINRWGIRLPKSLVNLVQLIYYALLIKSVPYVLITTYLIG